MGTGRRGSRARPPSRLRPVSFPEVRMRRLRRSEGLRRLVRETRVAPADLDSAALRRERQRRRSPDPVAPGPAARLRRTSPPSWRPRPRRRGVGGMLLFGLPDSKDEQGSSAWDDAGPVQSAIRAIRAQAPGLPVMTDVCLCQYTSHGACGVLREGEVDNDATLPLLARVARLPRARGRRRRRALGHDGRPRGGAARARSTATAARASRSSPTARSSPRPSTARSATRPARRPSPATARATSSTRPTRARPCARRCSTRPRAPTR